MNRIKFVDRLAQGRISRRDAMRAAAAFGVGMVAMPRNPLAAEPLTIMEWSGYEIPELFQSFVDKHGSAPNFSIFANEDEALQKVRGGFNADIVHPCTYSVTPFVEAGLSKPIDTSRLSHWADVFEPLKTTGTVIDGNVVMVPADWGISSIAYRTDLVEPDFLENESWGIFTDERYAGRLSMSDTDAALQIAGLLLGYSRDRIHQMSDEELEACRPLAAKMVQYSRFLWTDNTEIAQALASGEIVAAYAWNETVKTLAEQGLPVKYAYPKEGRFTWLCGLTLLNTGKGDEAQAYDFLDAWLSPETGKFMIEQYGYGHSNRKAFEMSDPAAVEALGITDPIAYLADGILFQPIESTRQQKMIKMWEELKALKQ
jgi:spermidine/putrescine-binding protein